MTHEDGWPALVVALNAHVSLTMRELVEGWQAHVRRFLVEFDSDPGDRDVWGVHDYIGALHLRDALERGLDLLGGIERDDAALQVGDTDRQLKAKTEPDHDGLIYRHVSPAEGGDGWWWRRIPVAGPVRDELDTQARGTG